MKTFSFPNSCLLGMSVILLPSLLLGQAGVNAFPPPSSGTLYKHALASRDANQIDSSIHYATKAFHLAESNQEWDICIRSLYLRGSGLMNKGAEENAIQDFEKADNYRVSYFPRNDSLMGESHYLWGAFYFVKKQYKQAIDRLMEAHYFYSAAYGETHWKVGKANGFIGKNYFLAHDYDSALLYTQWALDAIDTTSELSLKKFELDMLEMAGRISGLKKDLSYQLQILIRQKELAEKEGRDNYVVFLSYPRIAQNYLDQHDYSQALIYFQKSRTNARSLIGAGQCYKYLGDIDTALSLYHQAFEFCQKWKGGNLVYIPTILHGIGLLYMDEGMLDQAITYFQQVLQQSENHPLPPLEQAKLLGNIGNLLSQQGKMEQADSVLREGEELMIQFFGLQHPTLANNYATQAQRFSMLSDWDSCFFYIQKSLSALANGFHPIHAYSNPRIEQILAKGSALEYLVDKADYLYQAYNCSSNDSTLLSAALDTYLFSFNLADSLRLGFQHSGSKEAVLQEMLPAFEQALEIASTLFQQSQDEQYLHIMFDLMERSKAYSLYESLSHHQAVQFAGIPDSLQKKERQLKIDLAYYEKMLAEGDIQPNPNDPLEHRQIKYTGKLYDLREDYRHFRSELKQRYPQYHQLKYEFSVASVQEARKILPGSRSLLIEYFLGDNSCFILGIDHQQIRSTRISIDQKWLDTLDQFIRMMHGKPLKEDHDLFRELSADLYRKLILPILGDRRYDHLLIIPDGKLGYVPFASLCTEINPDHPDQGYGLFPYLVRQSSIQYANSATILTNRISTSRHLFHQASRIGGFAPSYPDSLRLNFNEAEVASARGILGGQTFIANQASESNFKREAPHFPILHLAMHGYPDEEHPMLAHLAFTETNDSLEDHKLHAYEIFQMSLSAELAVLSACHTGYGPLAKGDGIKSLGRAFHFAGCPSILISQWEATGASSRLIMKHFYHFLAKGKSKSEALRIAQTKYLEEAPPYLRHPRYWANFALIGADDPVRRSWSVLWILGLALVVIVGFILVKAQQVVNHDA